MLLKDLAAGQVLLDADPQRLLHVGVLLRPCRRDGDRHVPVVRRGDDHGVDIGAGQHFAEISIGLAAAHFCVGLPPVLVGIGNRHALAALAVLKLVEIAPAADADMADGHAALAGGLSGPPRAVEVMT